VEAEVSGEVIDRLQILAGYTYTQTKTLDDIDGANEGGVFNSYVPRHMLRVWADYELDGALNRFTVGGGVNAQSDNYRENGTVKNTQSGYAIWNGRVGYRIDDTWSVAVNGNNLFDRKYYRTIGTSGYGNYYGDPRNFMLTVKADF
jgi:outer membrane receptor for ferric coprogen and ferric-rhodotorulic acid